MNNKCKGKSEEGICKLVNNSEVRGCFTGNPHFGNETINGTFFTTMENGLQ